MDRLSISKVRAWQYCPALFMHQYILGLEPYNVNFEFGSDYHKLVEMYHKRLEVDYDRDRRTGEILRDEAGEPLRTYHLDMEQIKPYADEYPADFYDTAADTTMPTSGTLVGMRMATLVEVRLVEQLIHPTRRVTMPLPFTMVMDGIRLQEPGRGLYDLKTSATSWSQAKADEDIQATLYCYAWWQLTGELFPFNFIVVRKNPGPRTKAVQPLLTTTRSVEDFATLWEQLCMVADEIVNAREYPCKCADQQHVIVGVTQ